jgi:hypothetical protein
VGLCLHSPNTPSWRGAQLHNKSTGKTLPLSLLSAYKTVILPVVLYGCETWFLTLREEHRLRVFGNRVLRRIFGPTGKEVAGEWRRLNNEELHDL